MSEIAKLRTDLIVSETEIDNQLVYNIKDPITESYFRLRAPEYWLVSQFDGETPYEEIAERFQETFQLNISVDQILQFVSMLQKLYFLDDGRAEQATSRASLNVTRGSGTLAKLLFIKLKAFNPGRFLDWLTDIYRPFHNRFWFFIESLFMLFGLYVLFQNSSHFDVNLAEVFQLGSIVAVVMSVFVIVSLHEFAHAVICRYYGGEVREIGFLLLYLQPCFYSDLSDAWLFKEKRQRLAVTFAGPYFQVILLAFAVVVWRVTVIGSFPNEVARIIVVVSWITMLFNFNPLIKLDGYYLLSDWVDIPNLRQKSFRYFSNLFKRRILGWPIQAIRATTREKRVFISYAIGSLAYSLFLIVYLLIIIAQFLLATLGGLGLLLLFILVLLILRKSIVSVANGIVQHVRYMKTSKIRISRLIVWCLAIASFTFGIFAIPFPFTVSGEVVVRPLEQFDLLLNEFGLLESTIRRGGEHPETRTTYLQMTSNEMASLGLTPLVRDGQSVYTGDTLAILASNQVTKEIVTSIADLEKYQGQLALLKSPPKKEAVEEGEALVQAAKASVDQYERELYRVEELRKKALSSQGEYDVALTNLQLARAELAKRTAQLNLLKSPPKPEEKVVIQAQIDRQKAKVRYLQNQEDAQSVIAPFGGTIEVRPHDDYILSIINDETVEVLVPVSDFDINLIAVDQKVDLKLRPFPSRLFNGHVVHIPSTASMIDNRSYYMVAVSIANKDHALQKGMTGFAKIRIDKRPLAQILFRKVASFVRVEFWSWW